MLLPHAAPATVGRLFMISAAILLAACSAGGPQTQQTYSALAAASGCAVPVAGSEQLAQRVASRQHLFGAENVNPDTGEVDPDQVILAWFGISSYAASLKGRVVLLDAFIQSRTERPGYVPTTLEELAAAGPEAIILGHGHGDHAESAAVLAGATCATIIGTPEHCEQVRAGAAELYGNDVAIDCVEVTEAGSGLAQEIVQVGTLEPEVCMTAFRHLHSDAVLPDLSRIPPNIPLFLPDPGSYLLHPPGPPPYDTQAGLAGDEGGSLLYQFQIGDFSMIWMDTVGPVKENAPELLDFMRELPATDVMLGAILGFNIFTNGFRDVGMYIDALQPRIFVPSHHDFIAPDGAQDDWERTFAREMEYLPVENRPEVRWMVNPDDYVRPELLRFDMRSPYWAEQVTGRAPAAACN